jgi:branched-chain amino acid transport system substrate-binding protein
VERAELKVALSISTRVSGAADTLPTYRGFVLAMEDAMSTPLSAAGVPVELGWEMFDDAGDVELSRTLAERIVADPAYVGVVGPMGSSEAFANAPVFDAAGLLQVSPCASHPDLCERGFRTFHRLVANERVQGLELAKIARRHLGASRVAVIHDLDAFGTSVADNFTHAFEDLGGTVVARLGFAASSVDPVSVAGEMAATDAEVFLFAVHAHEGGLVSAAARDAAVTVPFLGTDGLKTSFFLGGGDGRGEAYHTHTGADMRRLPSAREFRERYVARFPEDSTYSPEAYDAAMLVVEAITRSTTPDRAGVLRAFESIDRFDGITGPISFTDAGERAGAFVSLYQVTANADGRAMSYLGTTAELCPDPARRP